MAKNNDLVLKELEDLRLKNTLLEKKISDKFLLHVLGYGIGYLYQGMNIVEKEIV